MEITARPRRRGWLRALRVVVGVAAVVMLVPPALGYGTHVVSDDAMDGGYPRGSLVFDEQLSSGQLAVGDVVTLTPPGGDLVVRRVASVDDEGVRTSGDATGADPWVVPESRADRVAFTVPYLGWPLLAIHSMSVPPWAPAAVALGMAVVLVGLRRSGRGGGGAPALRSVTVEGVSAVRPTPPAG